MAEKVHKTGFIEEIDGEPIVFEDPLDRELGNFTLCSNVIMRDATISPVARLVYFLIRSYAHAKNHCFPGQERLAEDTGRSVRHIRSALQELKQCGLIDWKQRGLGQTNLYVIKRIDFDRYAELRNQRLWRQMYAKHQKRGHSKVKRLEEARRKRRSC